MADAATHPVPDDLEQPTPHDAASQSTVETVLGYLQRVGGSVLSLFVGLLAAVLILYSGYVLYDTFYTQNQAFGSAWDVLKFRPQIIDDGAVPLSGSDLLAEINDDYRAWLTVYDTKIDYPVMQGDDDLYYASHDIYGESSLTGAIYLAAANSADLSDSYNIIFGHHMDNGAMFGGLDKFTDEAYFRTHRTGILVSSKAVYDLTIFATVATDAYERTVYNVGSISDELMTYIDEHAIVKNMAVAEGATKIVGLSTCASAETNGRLVVYYTMTERDLDPSQTTDPDDFLVVTATGYEGVYDAQYHAASAVANLEGALIEYSLDGVTWSTVPPTIKNVGITVVYVRATYGKLDPVYAECILHVTPAPVEVVANDATKTYGEEDPAFTATVSGVIDDFVIVYDLSRINDDEDVGVYEGVIMPSGEEEQGNYIVTYKPGTLTIVNGELTIAATGYDGVFDAQWHAVTATTNVPGAEIRYSIDGGVTWTTTPPDIYNVGTVTVLIEASAENYETVTTTVTLRVRPRPVTVTADGSNKILGAEDPTFTASVSGVIDGFEIVYDVTRPGAGTDEAVGTYTDAIVPFGEAEQGNYIVTYIPADFVITEPLPPEPTEPPEIIIPDPEPPRTPVDVFEPTGSSYGAAWALINLICVILTIYILFPLLHLKGKYGRAKTMEKINEENGDVQYDAKKFRRKFAVCFVLESILSIGAVVAFILTEDMRLPMVLIDKWTPLMLLILALTWVTDILLNGVKEKKPEEEVKE